MSLRADTHYVSLSGGHVPPFANWADAATNIQDAIDVTSAGDAVWVTNGIYSTGCRILTNVDWVLNRVAVTNAVLVLGVNGPSVTCLMGSNATRCAYVADGAVLSGFTLTNAYIDNVGKTVYALGGGARLAAGGVISNCAITGCRMNAGGGSGVFGGTAIQCLMEGNRVDFGTGGGMAHGRAVECVIRGNHGYYGGGTAYNTNEYCLIGGNLADSLGGGTLCSVNRSCRIVENEAENAGGTRAGENIGCAIMGNQCLFEGGGSGLDANRNCTIVDNVADMGGGTSESSNFNCVVYYNSARLAFPNWQHGEFGYSCTTPLPEGEGNMMSEPVLMGLRNPHLLAQSPCRDAGSNSPSGWAVDLDGQPRVHGAEVDIGADEYDANSMTGQLEVAMAGDYTNAVVGAVLTFASDITGMAQGFSWTSGDAWETTNNWRFRHAWASTGSFPVVLTVWNAAMTASATRVVNIVQGFTNFVSREGAHLPPFTNWLMAATNIQDALDALTIVGGTVLVTNGVYDAGEKSHMGFRNRIAILMPAYVRSVNGPSFSTILGNRAEDPMQQCRCAYVAAGATLAGFTLSNGQTYVGDILPVVSWVLMCGGGVYCEEGGNVTDCVIRENNALFMGGGICGGTVRNCLIMGNTCSNAGGGAAAGQWRNCTIVENRAAEGGGVYGGAGHNVIVMHNLAGTAGDNFASNTLLSYACADPLPPGSNNIASDPLFTGTGDWRRLSPSSPCIDAGINDGEMQDETDLDGRPRIINGTVDLGAHEFHFDVRVKAFLQGPYNTNEHEMAAGSKAGLPTASPYAADPRPTAGCPSNVMDWVLIQVRPEPVQKPVFARSAFLGCDGWTVAETGVTQLVVEVSPGTTNYLAISHRNHLAAMSAQPMVFTNQTLIYDFTIGPVQFYGGTNTAVQLEPGVWGMIAGDADGDGKITAVDKAIVEQQTGMSGYLSGDFDLNGVVDE